MDEVIQKYAKRLQSIYDNHTAGDYTFSGVLHKFLIELGVNSFEEWGVQYNPAVNSTITTRPPGIHKRLPVWDKVSARAEKEKLVSTDLGNPKIFKRTHSLMNTRTDWKEVK